MRVLKQILTMGGSHFESFMEPLGGHFCIILGTSFSDPFWCPFWQFRVHFGLSLGPPGKAFLGGRMNVFVCFCRISGYAEKRAPGVRKSAKLRRLLHHVGPSFYVLVY